MIDRESFAVYKTATQAKSAERAQRLAMSPLQRLAVVEQLRALIYPDAKNPPRLLRVLETAQRAGR